MDIRKTGLAALLFGTIISSPAGAISVDREGLGSVLYYPYYTVNNGQDTLLTIVNPGGATVMKVRFLEGYNSRPVLDFNVYLGAFDTWTAVISQSADGGVPVLHSGDHSCTTPAIAAAGLPFTTAQFDGTGALPADAGPHDATRTREGFIEVMTGGNFSSGAATVTAITPVQTDTPGEGVPPGCATLPGSLLTDLTTSEALVYGSSAIVDVSNGIYYATEATALRGFELPPVFPAVENPLEPSIAEGTADGEEALVFTDAPVPYRVHYERKIDAVSAALMVSQWTNDYLVDPSLGAVTDWIVRFPTKRYYTDPAVSGSTTALAPFANVFHSPGISEVPSLIRVFDREAGTAGGCTQVHCVDPLPVRLDFAVNAVSFRNPVVGGLPPTSSVFGSFLTENGAAPFGTGGLAILNLGANSGLLPGGTVPNGFPEVTLFGEPAIGFMAYKIVNSHAQPGKLANYAGTFRHHGRASGTCPLGPCA